MDWILFTELAVMLVCIWLGSRSGGISLGFWGGVGLVVLAFVFREAPAEPPIDVMLIILAVTCATATMQAAGGIDFLVTIAQAIIKKYPSRITFVAPLVSYIFTFAAGTGHILYPLLPVIHDTALRNGIRPERPMTVSVVASLQGITASPVSAAMAALIVIVEPLGFSLHHILMIAVPSTIIGVLASAAVMMKWGKELEDDPEFQRRVASGEVEDIPALVKIQRLSKREKISMDEAMGRLGIDPSVLSAAVAEGHAKASAVSDAVARENGARAGSGKMTTFIFLFSVVLVVVLAAVPSWRPLDADGKPISVAITIQFIMLSAAALMCVLTKVKVKAIVDSAIAKTGLVALVGIFGLAWLGLTVIEANEETIVAGLKEMVTVYPWTFAIAVFACSILLFSQASTTRTLFPLGVTLGLGAPALTAMWPAVNGAFFLPTYGTIVAALNFDRTGTTKIGKLVLNHSFMVPGLVAIVAAVTAGFGISALVG